MLVERKEFSVYFSPSRAVDSTRRSLPKRCRSFISFEKENIFSSFSLLFFLFVVTTELFFKFNSTVFGVGLVGYITVGFISSSQIAQLSQVCRSTRPASSVESSSGFASIHLR
jgi:hypothetical protein